MELRLDVPHSSRRCDRVRVEILQCHQATSAFQHRSARAESRWRVAASGFARPAQFLASGEYLGHIGLSADITERNKIEQDRQFELSLIRSIHRETIEGILVVNEAGEIVSHNRRFLEIWKISAQDADRQWPNSSAGAPNLPLLLAAAEQVEDREAFLARILALYKHPDERDHCEVVLKDGRTLERHSTGLRDPEGKYLGRVWFYRDVTDQRQAEASLQNAKMMADQANRRLLAKRLILDNERQMLRALIDNIPDFMYVKDTDSRFVVANLHLARAVGVETPEEVIGKTDFDFYPQELANAFYEDEQNILRSGQPLCNREERGVDGAGNETHILTTKVPLRNSQGQVDGIAGVGRDISDRKKMENALREAERKYRGIFDEAIVGYLSEYAGRALPKREPSHGPHLRVRLP